MVCAPVEVTSIPSPGFSSQFLLSSMALLAGHGCFPKDDKDALLTQAEAWSSHFICALPHAVIHVLP